MTIAARFDHYLKAHNIHFQTISHQHSQSSLHSGVAAGVPLPNLAKAVVLEDHQGHHVLAVLPSNNKISLSRINDKLNGSFHLVKEQQVYDLFQDCEHGAVPPMGSPYRMATLCDDVLTHLDVVYLEAGDHETLLKLDQAAFNQLMTDSKRFRFSGQVFH